MEMSATGSEVKMKSWTKGMRQRVKALSRTFVTSGAGGGLARAVMMIGSSIGSRGKGIGNKG